jgi:hypothetical protein
LRHFEVEPVKPLDAVRLRQFAVDRFKAGENVGYGLDFTS